jgi:ribosomal-protein-alanine N-acetyltransferase
MPGCRLIGYIVWWQVVDEAEIINLAVSPEQRGQGVGRLLLKCMIDQAWHTGASCIHLDVRESNQPARRLYDQAGFLQTGMRMGYYANDQENAITMLKRLT